MVHLGKHFCPLFLIPRSLRYQSNLYDCIVSRGLKAKMSGHASVAGMVREVQTKWIKIVDSDKIFSCTQTITHFTMGTP